jgi:small multidrug resistance family-3 protein
MFRYLIVIGLLVLATTMETAGDALVRMGLYDRVGLSRIPMLAVGAVLLFGYGLMLNLAPLPFERVVGLYIATLFIIWQVVSYISFRAVPNMTILICGAFIIVGGLIVSFGGAAE